MLFNNFEPYTVPEKGEISWETLRNRFPSFFDSENPQGIRINAIDSKFRTVKRVNDKNKIPAGTVRVAPQPVGGKAVANMMIEGKQVFLQYSSTMPDIGAKSKKFPFGANRIVVSNGMTIRPGQDALLFFLYFGSGMLVNGYKPSAGASFEFINPAEKAAKTIQDWKARQAMESLIYQTLSYDQVKKAMKGLNIETEKTEAENREKLCARVRQEEAKKNELFMDTFYQLTAKAEDSKAADPSEILQSQMDAENIKIEEGKVYSKSKTNIGEWNKTPLYDTKQSDPDMARLVFIDHLKTNTVLLEKIAK